MSRLYNFSKVTLGIAALSLSTSLWAGSAANMVWDPINGSMESATKVINNFDSLGIRHAMSGPTYIVTDKWNGAMYELDGIKCGRVVSDKRHKVMNEDALKGDRITDMRTNRSGIITGIKDQGTMEVTHSNGKTVRYQYVTFKINPEK